MRSLLSIGELSPEDLGQILALSRAPAVGAPLEGKGVAMVFEHPSARTRSACEMAVVGLGGHPVAIAGGEVGIDSRETAEDVALTLSCYHCLIAARTARHSALERMRAALEAAGSDVGVLNLLSDREHPTQALADLLTIAGHFGSLEGRVVTYVGDANNVCRSLVGLAALSGMHARVAAPAAYSLSADDVSWAARLGAAPECLEDPLEAATGADVLYTDVWVSMGQGADEAAREAALADYRLDERLVEAAAPGAVVMHCLPAHRGEEISAAVLDGPRSIVWDQARNRMHALSGVIRYLSGERTPGPGFPR
ncbi:MAG: ornithine carbamoyltransferase [Acidimicrobiales bacterium]